MSFPFDLKRLAGITRAVMLDLETKDNIETGQIIQISAIVFNPQGGGGEMVDREGQIICPHIDLMVEHDDGSQSDRTVSQDTLNWWNEQDAEVRKRIFFSGPRVQLKDALLTLEDFCIQHNVQAIFAHPPSFDTKLIRNACRQKLGRDWGEVEEGQRGKLPFYIEWDSKTLEMFVFGRNTRNEGDIHHFGDKHNAVHDCIAQALMVQSAFRWRFSMAGTGMSATRGG